MIMWSACGGLKKAEAAVMGCMQIIKQMCKLQAKKKLFKQKLAQKKGAKLVGPCGLVSEW